MSKETNEMIKRIKQRIKIKEEKLERKLTPEEKQKIKKIVIKEYKRENRVKNIKKGIFLALGIIGIGTGAKNLLTDGSEHQIDNNSTEIEMEINKQDEEIKDFKESLQVNVNEIKQEQQDINYDQIINEIIEEYNEKYNMELTENDISYIKSKPQFLGINNGTYIQDYKQNTQVEEYIKDNIKEVYVMVNNQNDSIISSLGIVDKQITNIDTKVVMDQNKKEYFESSNKIDFTKDKNEEEIKQIYNAIENQYEKEIEEQR